MTERVEIAVTLTLRSPFLLQGLASGIIGLDATQLRTEDNDPILPAAQLQGVLREALLDIAEAAPGVIEPSEIDALFGTVSPSFSDAGEHDRPARARLLARDLVATGLREGGGDMIRVEIDDATGAAKTGHFQAIELVAPCGREVAFAGTLTLLWPKAGVERIVAAIDKAVKLIAAIGAFKTAGFGEVMPEKSSAHRSVSRSLMLPQPMPIERNRLGFSVTFDRPLLVDAQRVADNAFAGADIVPGAVFKGALARKIDLALGDAATSYQETLAQIVISHAFPCDRDGGPGGEPIPLSTVAFAEADEPVRFGDALRLTGRSTDLEAEKIGPIIDGKPALFQTDWKGAWFAQARTALGRPPYEPPLSLPRTHTAIGEDGVAATHQLFTTIARSTRDPADRARPRCFLLTVDLAQVTNKETAAALIALMWDGLDGIGKTGATTCFKRHAAGDTVPQPVAITGHTDLYAVVLRTPALLTDPRSRASAAAAYVAYWAAAIPGARLIDFCAAQTLVGGHLAMRRRPWGSTYHPFVATRAGSVFVLAGPVGARLEELCRTNLPLPDFEGAAALDWRNCPFMPENGYGEIRADYLSAVARSPLWRTVAHV